jgi:hypothetical protein
MFGTSLVESAQSLFQACERKPLWTGAQEFRDSDVQRKNPQSRQLDHIGLPDPRLADGQSGRRPHLAVIGDGHVGHRSGRHRATMHGCRRRPGQNSTRPRPQQRCSGPAGRIALPRPGNHHSRPQLHPVTGLEHRLEFGGTEQLCRFHTGKRAMRWDNRPPAGRDGTHDGNYLGRQAGKICGHAHKRAEHPAVIHPRSGNGGARTGREFSS